MLCTKDCVCVYCLILNHVKIAEKTGMKFGTWEYYGLENYIGYFLIPGMRAKLLREARVLIFVFKSYTNCGSGYEIRKSFFNYQSVSLSVQ